MDMSFNTNNGRVLEFIQLRHDEEVHVSSFDENEHVDERPIPAMDFVMLYNFYKYIKGNDIYNEFINPNGKEVE